MIFSFVHRFSLLPVVAGWSVYTAASPVTHALIWLCCLLFSTILLVVCVAGIQLLVIIFIGCTGLAGSACAWLQLCGLGGSDPSNQQTCPGEQGRWLCRNNICSVFTVIGDTLCEQPCSLWNTKLDCRATPLKTAVFVQHTHNQSPQMLVSCRGLLEHQHKLFTTLFGLRQYDEPLAMPTPMLCSSCSMLAPPRSVLVPPSSGGYGNSNTP